MLFPAWISATEFDDLLQGPRWTGNGKSPWNIHIDLDVVIPEEIIPLYDI